MKMSRVIGLIEIDTVGDSDFIASDDRTLDFLFAGLCGDTLARSHRFAAIICLGAVVQGETLHHKYINTEVSRAIMEIGIDTGIPILFGVLTCRNMEQALARAGGSAGNKGCEAALAALEMVGLLRKLSPPIM